MYIVHRQILKVVDNWSTAVATLHVYCITVSLFEILNETLCEIVTIELKLGKFSAMLES